MAAEQTQSEHRYALDNAHDEAGVRLSALAELYDAGTIQVLTRLGVRTGWHCLEVGAGRASIPLWLADQVGSAGSVLVTDISSRFLASIDRPNIEVCQHDITTDPLPAAAFDLVHSRLVLQHVGDQDRALQQMVAALKPGGWLVVEDFGSEAIARDPEFPEPAVLTKVRASYAVARAPGVRLLSLHRLRQLFGEHGLGAVGAEGRLIPWVGGTAGGRLNQATIRQRRADDDGTAAVTPTEVDQAIALLGDPDTVVLSPLLWAVWGQRPTGAT